MGKAAEQPGFDALDACHRQIQEHLVGLRGLAQDLAEFGLSDGLRACAKAIEAFFSATARQHHEEEEVKVFPVLLASGDSGLIAMVHILQQDHRWIEENWRELSPRLRAIALGNGWIDETEFLNYVKVFLELMNGHIALEETLIYPKSKARWAQAVAARLQRLESLRA